MTFEAARGRGSRRLAPCQLHIPCSFISASKGQKCSEAQRRSHVSFALPVKGFPLPTVIAAALHTRDISLGSRGLGTLLSSLDWHPAGIIL